MTVSCSVDGDICRLTRASAPTSSCSPVAHDGREALQLRRDLVRADARRDAVHAALVGDRHERVARGFVHRRHRHTGQHAARGVGHRAGERRFLGIGGNGQQENSGGQKQPPDDPVNVMTSPDTWTRMQTRARNLRDLDWDRLGRGYERRSL